MNSNASIGPWKHTPPTPRHRDLPCGGYWVCDIKRTEGFVGILVQAGVMPRAQAEANASLISAAPRLRDALQKLCDSIELDCDSRRALDEAVAVLESIQPPYAES